MKRILMNKKELLPLLHEARRVCVRVDYKHDDFCEVQVSKSSILSLLNDITNETRIRACYWGRVLRIG